MTPIRRLGLIELACVTGLLLLAASLRLYRLQDFPAGYHNDEVAAAHLTEQVMAGRLGVFFPEETGTEPLYMYAGAPFGWLLGPSVFAFRLPSVFLFMLGLCAVWILARRLLGRLVAGVTLAAMSVSWWGMLLGRITLHVVAVLPSFALAVYFFCRGCGIGGERVDGHAAQTLDRARRGTAHLALSGCFFALAFYSYTAARVMPILVIAFVAYLAVVRPDVIRCRWRGLVILVAVAFIVSAPLAIYLLTHPGIKQLSYTNYNVDQPITDLLSGQPHLIVETALQTLGMFGFTGDPLAYYSVPGRSLLEPIGAALFWLGVLAAVWRWRDPRYGLVLIGWLVTLMPGMFSQPAPNYARTVGAMVFAFVMSGIGADLAWRRVEAKWGRGAWRAATAAAVLVLIGNAVWMARDYFVIWPAQPGTRWWMQTGLKEVADALNADPQRGPLAICSASRLMDENIEWWRPAWWTYHYLSPRTEADARWYDCAESAVIPPGEARYAFPDVTSVDQLAALPIGKWMRGGRVLGHVKAHQSLIVSADLSPARSAEVKQLARDAPVTWPPEAMHAQPMSLPIDFGHAVELMAYDVPDQVQPGAVLTVTTVWLVTAQLNPRLVMFTHILTGTRIVAQQDRLRVSSQHLRPGDMFEQVHAIELPANVERGWYQLAIGIYAAHTGKRMQVYADEQPVADRVFLRQIRVRRR